MEVYFLKCKDCSACKKGFFKSQPNKYVCTGTKEPFIIYNIENLCTEYSQKCQEKIWSWNETYRDDWTHGTFDSKEEAIQDAIGYYSADCKTKNITIKIGQCEYVPLRTDADPDRIIGELDEKYCDDSGCDYYIYDGVTDEERKWLEDKLSDLMNEFHQKIGLNPGWFKVVTMEKINLNDYRS